MQKTKSKKTQFTTINQVLGDTGGGEHGKYNTLDLDEYKDQLTEMGRADLQIHATKVGVMPRGQVDLMKRELVKEFNKHVASYNFPAEKETKEKAKNGTKKQQARDQKLIDSLLKEAGGRAF